MSMRVRNVSRLERRLRALPGRYRDEIGREIAVSLVELDAHAKTSIQGGGRSGRLYRRRSIVHQASAPGEYPKTDTGQLVASLFFRMASDKLSGFFGSMLGYARHLELKAAEKGGRPWLSPTFQAKEAGIRARIREAVRKATRRAGNG